MALSRTSQGKLGIMAEAARQLFLKKTEEAGDDKSFFSLSMTGSAPFSRRGPERYDR